MVVKLYSVVAKNLRMMTSFFECSMPKLVTRESMAGNAGTEVINGVEYPCYAANFYYDKQTGEILCFENPPDPRFDDKAAKGMFRIAVDIRQRFKSEYTKIVNISFDNRASAEANGIIQQSANVYSSIYTGLIK